MLRPGLELVLEWRPALGRGLQPALEPKLELEWRLALGQELQTVLGLEPEPELEQLQLGPVQHSQLS